MEFLRRSFLVFLFLGCVFTMAGGCIRDYSENEFSEIDIRMIDTVSAAPPAMARKIFEPDPLPKPAPMDERLSSPVALPEL